MNGKPSNAKEALVAELLGDMQVLLTRLEQADQSAKATASAVTEASALYRNQVDELVSKLRTETASIVLKTTEHAAQSLVGQQQATLQKAATQAIQQAISAHVLKRARRDWFAAVMLSAAVGAGVAAVLLALRTFFVAA